MLKTKKVLEVDLLLGEAVRIAEQLRDSCRPTPDGGATWFGPTGYGTELIPLRTVQLGPQLYDGVMGVALFLATLEQLCGEGRYGDLALDALRPLRRRLAILGTDPERADRLRMPMGGLIGLGSFVYGFLKVGELLNEPSLIRDAHDATILFTSDRIGRDCQGRIQTGCAGAILALLALNKKFPEPNRVGKTPLDLNLEFARHLIHTRTLFEGCSRAWGLSPGKPPLAGFSYGAAGISYALLRLYEATGSQELWDAAQEGIAFVRELYSPERGSWRDIRAVFEARYRPRRGTWRDWWASGTLDDLEEVADPAPPEERFPEMWCHGAAGIALGRIAALHLDDTLEIRQEIESVLKRVRSYAWNQEVLNGPDDLCCGHMGLIELLLCASQRLGDQDSLDAAWTLMDRVQQRAQARGSYKLSAARGSDIFAPSLFQGISGVGYTLLRLVEPEKVPCLLLLE